MTALIHVHINYCSSSKAAIGDVLRIALLLSPSQNIYCILNLKSKCEGTGSQPGSQVLFT